MSILQEQFLVDAEGKKPGVILSLKRYQGRIEDSHDLSAVAERRTEELLSLNEMKRRVKRNGFSSCVLSTY
jgi:hypothetical protein